MKLKKSLKVCKVVLLSLLICVISSVLYADTPTTIKTPNCSTVPDTYQTTEMSQSEIDAANNWATTTYPNAILIATSTRTYNCHGYAWHVSEGGNRVWIGYYTTTAEDIYWQDGSYDEVATEAEATKVSYVYGNHSAVTTSQSGWFISKWGRAPRMRHVCNDCPYDYSQLKYYSRGSGFSTSKWADFATNSGWTSQVVGDFNNDGRDDIANFHPNNGTWWVSIAPN